MTEPPPPPVFDCRARRHKVITTDGICCLCGARGVTDARSHQPTTPREAHDAPTLPEL